MKHICIRIGILILDYIAPAEQAHDIAHELASAHADRDLSIEIDDNTHENLPCLPCSNLWSAPHPTRENGSLPDH